jgi:hypothetical protein
MMNACDKKMREELNMLPVRNTHEFWAMADLCSLAEEGRLAPEDASREVVTGASPGSVPPKKGGSRKHGPPQVLATEASSPARANKKTQENEEVAGIQVRHQLR